MSLELRLGEDMKSAMRARDEKRLSVIRMIRSAVLLEKKKANAPETIPDEVVIRIVQSHVKKLKEALEAAEKAGRDDLAAEARAEIVLAEVYVPAALTDAELEALVRESARQAGASGPGAMGAVMKVVMAKVAGRADGKRVQETVRRTLAG